MRLSEAIPFKTCVNPEASHQTVNRADLYENEMVFFVCLFGGWGKGGGVRAGGWGWGGQFILKIERRGGRFSPEKGWGRRGGGPEGRIFFFLRNSHLAWVLSHTWIMQNHGGSCKAMALSLKIPGFRKRIGVHHSMGHKVPWKTGILIYRPVTSGPLGFLQKEAARISAPGKWGRPRRGSSSL